jgi:glucokinase
MILAGDIGGTYTRLALFEPSEKFYCKLEKKFLSRDFSSLEEILQNFLGKERISAACFGIAGPVRQGRSQVVNLPWAVDASLVSQKLKIPSVRLLNDLEANAYGLRMLKPEELFLLHEGQARQEGNQALISAGTGLGEAGLYWDGKEHHPFPCEGGHADFAPRNPLEAELFFYLNKKFGHVSYERVVSGPGIAEIYHFLIETGRQTMSLSVQEAMKAEAPPKVISEFARLNKDAACVQAIDLFISLYGAEAGNLALKFLSLGGLYIGGGIAPHLIDKMKQGLFYSSFINKGRFKELLSSISIWVILNDRAALLGAAYCAMKKG